MEQHTEEIITPDPECTATPDAAAAVEAEGNSLPCSPAETDSRSEDTLSPDDPPVNPPVNPPAADPTPDIDRLIAEAEQRGYLRGRNEAIEETMASPALWENTRLTRAREMEEPDPASLFLSRLRPDVWD